MFNPLHHNNSFPLTIMMLDIIIISKEYLSLWAKDAIRDHLFHQTILFFDVYYQFTAFIIHILLNSIFSNKSVHCFLHMS